MATFVITAEDVMTLVKLQALDDEYEMVLPEMALALYNALPEALRSKVPTHEVLEEHEIIEGESQVYVTAADLVTMMLTAVAQRQWAPVLPFLDSLKNAAAYNEDRPLAYAEWMDAYAEFLDEHRNELATVAPVVEEPAEEQAGTTRTTRPTVVPRVVGRVNPILPFIPRQPVALASGPGVSGMSFDQQVEYYAGAAAMTGESAEFTCSHEEVETIWTHIYNGLGINTDDEKRRLRAAVLAYCLHNGCSPNNRSTKQFVVANNRSVAAVDVFGYVAEQAGTLRRFMRGMADEAVAYLKANPTFVPHWGRVHLGSRFERNLSFDFADGRTDIEPTEFAVLRNTLDRILDGQAAGNSRADMATPITGPAQGFAHRLQRPFRRQESRENDRYLE
jgi:hypothetical protein